MKPRVSNLQTSANSQAQALSGQSSIPDGGLTAWLQVLGANFLFFNSWFVRRVEELLCINTITHMQGHREYVRSLPGVLRKLSDRQLVIRNFVDRNFPRLPSDHFWHHWWSNFRPWILSCLAGNRHILGRLWYGDDEPRDNILADFPGARPLRWIRGQLPFPAQCCYRGDLL
jgi:hypothetical protein